MAVRIAVIGAGQMGRKHADLVASSRSADLVGICDVDPVRRDVAEQHNVPFFVDVAALLDDVVPDGAIIATPSARHGAAAGACAARGVHMLVEKPVADTVTNALQIGMLAAAAGVRVLVGHHRRYNPLVQAARAVAQGGALGRLVGVNVLWALKKPDDYFDVTWRRERPGGGPALINLIHDIDNLRFICGEIEQVFAQSSAAVRGFPVEDALAVSLRFAGGALGTMLAADSTPAPWSYELTTGENPRYPRKEADCYFFMGTAGSLAFPSMTQWRYQTEEASGWYDPLMGSRLAVLPVDPLEAQLEHFCRVVPGDEDPLVTVEDATRTLAVVLAILESATTGRLEEPQFGF